MNADTKFKCSDVQLSGTEGVCFKCFRCTLQLFYMDVIKVDLRGVASVLEVFFKCFICSGLCCKRSDLNVAYVSQICCKTICSKCFNRSLSYVAVSVFMLQVASVFYLNVAYVSHICCNCMF
jgi:hypothetical protein